MHENKLTIQVKERSSKWLKYGNFRVHPFQKDALDIINRIVKDKKEEFTILRIIAPVGAGKSFLIRQLINKIRGYPLILTYPTKILLNTQINTMTKELQMLGVPVAADWKNFNKEGINIFKYTTDEIVRIGLNDSKILTKRRGEIISEYLMHGVTNYRLPIMATTPDVLHILYNLKGYGWNTSRIIDFLTKSIVVFDEFHAYYNLVNFYTLLESLSNFSRFVILLSATPYINEAYWRKIEASYNIETVDFNESERKYSNEKRIRVFNKKLEVSLIKINNFSEDKSHIEPILEKINKEKGLHVVIYNSIFRLRHHKSLINKYNGVEWSGMKKEDLSEEKIVFGTSSVEVGVHFPFKTLVTEVDNWVSAIQRIGRVGRETEGKVFLLTRSYDLIQSVKDGETYERDEFEKILKQNLSEPDKDMIANELFRGESFNFLIFDRGIREIYPYSEQIFSMYYIDEPHATESSTEFKEELRDLAITAQLNNNKVKELLVRDKVSPFFGILYGNLRKYYSELEYEKINKNEIKILKPQLLSFRRIET